VTQNSPVASEDLFSLLRNDLLEKNTGSLEAQYLSSYASPLLDRLLEGPDQAFDGAGHEVLKADAKTALARTSFDGHSFVVKRYPVKNLWHRIRLFFKPSRAQKNFLFARRLAEIGIRTIRPVAWIQERTFGLRARSWLVYEHVDDSICADTLTDQSNQETVNRVIEAVVRNLSLMKDHLLSHGDMKPSNLLITPHEIVLIDLDAMKSHTTPAECEKGIAKDIARWMRWWRADRPQPGIAHRSESLLRDAGFTLPQG